MFCNKCGTNVPDGADFCPNCGADLRAFKSSTPMMDIPIAEAPDDAESDTTVLTADMSGPLTMEDAPKTEGFSDVQPEAAPAEPEVRQHQPQVPEGMVVTPAPVTGSSILSDSSVAPVGDTAQQEAPAPAPEPVQPAVPETPVAPVAPAPAPVQQVAPAPQQVYTQQQPAYDQMNNYAQPQGGVTVINQVASDNQEKLITPWGYIGYSFLFSIPLVGLILLFVWGFGGSSTRNLKNYCRAQLLMMLIVFVIWLVVIIISVITGAAILQGLDQY